MAGGRTDIHETGLFQYHWFMKNFGFHKPFLKPSVLCTQAVNGTA
jgi:hypothetical protein